MTCHVYPQPLTCDSYPYSSLGLFLTCRSCSWWSCPLPSHLMACCSRFILSVLSLSKALFFFFHLRLMAVTKPLKAIKDKRNQCIISCVKSLSDVYMWFSNAKGSSCKVSAAVSEYSSSGRGHQCLWSEMIASCLVWDLQQAVLSAASFVFWLHVAFYSKDIEIDCILYINSAQYKQVLHGHKG